MSVVFSWELSSIPREVLQACTGPEGKQVLEIVNKRIGPDAVALLAQYLKSANCSLRGIDLSRNYLGAEGAVALAGSLKDPNCRLEDLKLYDTRIGGAGLNALAKALINNHYLKTLSVSYNNYAVQEVEKIQFIANIVAVFTEKKRLDKYIELKWLGETGTPMLLKYKSRLESLSLDYLILTCLTAEQWFAFFSCGLKELSLWSSGVDDNGTCALAKSLSSGLCQLTRLNLSVNPIGEVGLLALAGAIQRASCQLASLSIRSLEMTKKSGVSFMKALANENCRLQILDLSHCQLKGSVLKVLVRTVTAGTCRLAELHLEGITSREFKPKYFNLVAEIIARSAKLLKKLVLRRNYLSQHQLAMLLGPLCHNQCLVVDFRHNPFEKRINKKLQLSLADMQSIRSLRGRSPLDLKVSYVGDSEIHTAALLLVTKNKLSVLAFCQVTQRKTPALNGCSNVLMCIISFLTPVLSFKNPRLTQLMNESLLENIRARWPRLFVSPVVPRRRLVSLNPSHSH